MLIWIDVETTGLDEEKDALLELGIIVTDDALEEVARASWVTNQARRWDPNEISPTVREMHRSNNLWTESIFDGVRPDEVDRLAWNFACCHASGENANRVPAGTNVKFDLGFLTKHARILRQSLHYRALDVSALNEAAWRFWPQVHAGRPPKRNIHRALPDLEDSIATARYYRDTLGVPVMVEEVEVRSVDPDRFVSDLSPWSADEVVP